MMRTLRLSRTGKRHVVFTGEEVFWGTTKVAGSTRWTNLKVYITEEGRWVVGVAKITLWVGESDEFLAVVFNRLDELLEYIERDHTEFSDQVAVKVHKAATAA